MKPAPFSYHAAESIAQTIELLQRLGSEAKVVAGGQSLGPMLNLRVARPGHLVDISRIAPLKTIEQRTDGTLRLGACVTHAQVEDSALHGDLGRYLRFVAGGIAYRAIRTRGTLGGSLAHADPAADWPCALVALGARAEISGPKAVRTVALGDFSLGMFETAVAPGEIVCAIEVPALPRFGWGYHKQVRKTGEFAHALAACVYRGEPAAEVWLGAIGGKPLRVAVDTSVLPRKALPEETRAAIYAQIDATLHENSRADASVVDDYARHMHALTATMAVRDAMRTLQ